MATAVLDESSDAGGLYDQPLVVKGKRQRKSVDSFAIKHEVKPVTKYEGGNGTKLGDIPFVEHYIIRHNAVELKPLHRLCLDRPGNKIEIKKNLREFNGFTFSKDSEQYKKKKAALEKLQKSALSVFLDTFGLHRSGSKEEQVDRLLEFLLEPTDTGKIPQARKRKKSTSSKRKTSKSSGGSKKAKLSSHTESSDDEEDGSVSYDENEEEEDNEPDEEAEDEITAPTDPQLKDVVSDILKGADLESVTNNSVCKQVFEKFPGIDLTNKKDFIKACIQKLLAES